MSVRSAAVGALKGASAGVDVVRAAAPLRRLDGITILIYHRVGAGTGGQMDLDPALFDDQLAWLVENVRLLTLDQAVEELDTVARVDDGVVLTFDDGTTDWVDHVLPALERHNVPATFYVATSFVDERSMLPGEGRPIDWAGLRELASSELVSIGSHTHRHMLLDRLDPSAIDEELDRSIELLGEHLGDGPGGPVAHFCYPKAVAGSDAAEAAVRERFRSAVLAGTRTNRPGVDLHRLHRSPIQASDGMRWFRRKATGGMRMEDDVRRLANRVRYRGLQS